MEHFRQILNRLPPSIGQELAGLPGSVLCSLEEIRLRCGQQVRLETGKGTQRIPHIVTAEELQETLNRLMRFSYYAYENDLAKGFVTIEGGHRVGVCVRSCKERRSGADQEISSLNIRFAKEIKAAATRFFTVYIKKTDSGAACKHTDHLAAGLRQNDTAARSGAISAGIISKSASVMNGLSLPACIRAVRALTWDRSVMCSTAAKRRRESRC